jgi:hypothetical protein
LHPKRTKLKVDENYRSKLYTKKINHFIKDNKVSTFESIEVLKKWRRLLIDEKAAYKHMVNQEVDRNLIATEEKFKSATNVDVNLSYADGKLKYKSDDFQDKLKGYLDFKNKVKEDEFKHYSDIFDFDGKIAVIEKIFVERVANVRAGFKSKYGKT